MASRPYVMHDQAHDKLREITRGGAGRPALLEQPGWLALTLLLVAFNLLALGAP